jgi:hypothetical protein
LDFHSIRVSKEIEKGKKKKEERRADSEVKQGFFDTTRHWQDNAKLTVTIDRL